MLIRDRHNWVKYVSTRGVDPTPHYLPPRLCWETMYLIESKSCCKECWIRKRTFGWILESHINWPFLSLSLSLASHWKHFDHIERLFNISRSVQESSWNGKRIYWLLWGLISYLNKKLGQFEDCSTNQPSFFTSSIQNAISFIAYFELLILRSCVGILLVQHCSQIS